MVTCEGCLIGRFWEKMVQSTRGLRHMGSRCFFNGSCARLMQCQKEVTRDWEDQPVQGPGTLLGSLEKRPLEHIGGGGGQTRCVCDDALPAVVP